MITICPGGWAQGCGHKELQMADDGAGDGLVSHGMCPECYRAWMKEAGLKEEPPPTDEGATT